MSSSPACCWLGRGCNCDIPGGSTCPVPSMHMSPVPLLLLVTQAKCCNGPSLVYAYLWFSARAAPLCFCVLVLEEPLLEKAREERPVPAATAQSLHGAPLPLGPSEEQTPGVASLQAEPTTPVAGCAEGGRKVSAPPRTTQCLHLSCFRGGQAPFHSPPGPHGATIAPQPPATRLPHPTLGVFCLSPQCHK